MRNRILAGVLMTVCVEASTHAAGAPWHAAWVSGQTVKTNAASVTRMARELGFDALITWTGKSEADAAFVAACKAAGLESYLSFVLTPPKGNDALAPFVQGLSEAESRVAEEIRKDPSMDRGGYQGGGEPVPGHRYDVFDGKLQCFRVPAVLEYLKATIRAMLEAHPDLTGVAFDYFGYMNFRECRCAYCQAHPADPLESLVAAQNELADHARGVRPGVKVTGHVYPVYLPEPLYGWRLNWDTAGETVGWFFPPFRAPDRVERDTRTLIESVAKRPGAPRPVPFVGYFAPHPKRTAKPPAQFRAELEAIRAAGARDLMVFSLTDIAGDPETRQALIDFTGGTANARE